MRNHKYVVDKSDIAKLLRGEPLALVDGQFSIEIMQDMTNGDMMQAVFPDVKVTEGCLLEDMGDVENVDTHWCDFGDPYLRQEFSADWWDAEYKESSVSENPNRWIPVRERLPEDRRAVLVTAYWHETYQVMMGSYYGDGLWWCVPFNNTGKHEQKLKPKAWMELPEPYRAESEGKE